MTKYKHEGWDMLEHYLLHLTNSAQNIDASLQKIAQVNIDKYDSFLNEQGSVSGFHVKLQKDNWNDE